MKKELKFEVLALYFFMLKAMKKLENKQNSTHVIDRK